MDPDAALAELLDIARAHQDELDDESRSQHADTGRMADLVMDLHDWLADKGGFLPAAWSAGRTPQEVRDQGYSLLPERAFIPEDQRCAGSRTVSDVKWQNTDPTRSPCRLVWCATCTGWYRPALVGLVPDHRVPTRPPQVLDYLLPDSVPGIPVDD